MPSKQLKWVQIVPSLGETKLEFWPKRSNMLHAAHDSRSEWDVTCKCNVKRQMEDFLFQEINK